MKHKLVIWVIALIIFSVGVLLEIDEESSQTSQPTHPKQTQDRSKVEGLEGMTAWVTRVVDGDTIVLESGEVVRYIGIDTPESRHPKRGLECFAEEAAQKNRELVEDKSVELVKDISEKDRYGRLLRYVYVAKGEEKIFVNEYLVREGFANVATFPPDVAHQNLFIRAEKEAREAGRGLWGHCS